MRIGALAPLTRPGWVEAGEHLVAGLELGARDEGSVELVVRDTAADPARAVSAVRELHELGVAAITGEFHSVVARAAAAEAHALQLPFLCSSAVIDTLCASPWVARLAPPQSRGWRIFAELLLEAGHTRVAAVTQPSVYWEAGIRILTESGCTVVPLEPCDALCDELAADGASAVLLLLGHPEPALPILEAIRGDERLAHLLVGAPAGQPELTGWGTPEGAGVPFLRYLPDRLTPLGDRVRAELGEPSFVALEGYDAILVLAELLRSDGASWPDVTVDGTRGRIGFSRTPDLGVWQWTWPPVQVADRDPAAPDRFRVLRSCAG